MSVPVCPSTVKNWSRERNHFSTHLLNSLFLFSELADNQADFLGRLQTIWLLSMFCGTYCLPPKFDSS